MMWIRVSVGLLGLALGLSRGTGSHDLLTEQSKGGRGKGRPSDESVSLPALRCERGHGHVGLVCHGTGDLRLPESGELTP